MKRARFFFWLAAITAVLLLSSCKIVINTDDDDSFRHFNSSLRGTWETPPGTPSDMDTRVVIDSDSITITGTGRPQPLDRFTPDSQLRGYSRTTRNSWDEKEGYIYIRDRGSWQSPVKYIYWEDLNGEKRLTLKASPDLTLFRQ